MVNLTNLSGEFYDFSGLIHSGSSMCPG